MKKQSLFFLILLATTLLLAACGGSGAQGEATLVPTPITLEKPTYTVQRGAITETVQLSGRVTPVRQENLFFLSGGVVNEVLVSVGDVVEAEDVLARLDEPEQYQANVASSELAYLQAQRNLEQVKLDMPIKLAEAKLALEAASDELVKAEAAVSMINNPHPIVDSLRLEKFRTDYAITKQTLETAQSLYDQLASRPETNLERSNALNALIDARRLHYIASVNLNWAEGNLTQAEIDQMEINLALAQGNYDKAEAEVALWEEDNPTSEWAMAELTLADAEARFRMAEKALEAVELRAPFGGQILSMGIAPGTSVNAFQVVLTLADPEELEIRALPTAEDLAKISLTQAAVVRLPSQSNEELPATITSVPPTAGLGDGNNNLDNSVHFQLEDDSTPLVLNDAVVVTITIDEREDVLWLPKAALRSFQGETFVYVEVGDVQRRVNVTVGLEGTDRVEIVSGLEEGQVVIGQ
jgi:multidrug efflux pump subunit AcrA (membrane-fusion protein)